MGRAARRFCSKLRFVDDARSTICRGQRFFALNVICLFLPAGWAKRRQSFGKRFVRGSTTLFACCVDKLIDQPGVEDHEFLFAPILTVDVAGKRNTDFLSRIVSAPGSKYRWRSHSPEHRTSLGDMPTNPFCSWPDRHWDPVFPLVFQTGNSPPRPRKMRPSDRPIMLSPFWSLLPSCPYT